MHKVALKNNFLCRTIHEASEFYKCDDTALPDLTRDQVAKAVKLKQVEDLLLVAEKYWNKKHGKLGARCGTNQEVQSRAMRCSKISAEKKKVA